MNNLRFATLVHLLVLLEKFKGQIITSEFIAGSINVNAVVVRRELKFLREIGWVISKKGKNGGIVLAIASEEIFFGAIYRLMMKEQSLIRLNSPNPKCPIGQSMNMNLTGIIERIDESIVRELDQINLKNFTAEFSD